MTAYYNEWEPYAAQWLRNLIAAGLIAPGDVDERSITDVSADDLVGYRQCHFFAGIGGWSLGLRLAGWPDDREVWTGSCPCQPFSAAGKRKGVKDERHLWPEFRRLIAKRRPPIVFGEQVASEDGLEWLDLVRADLEAAGYAAAAADLCAAGIGAPHIRQRLWWVADSDDARLERRFGVPECADQRTSGPGGLAGGLADAERGGCKSGPISSAGQEAELSAPDGSVGWSSPLHGFWRDADWLYCRDRKWRPVEPRTSPLVDGLPERVDQLRAYGNAIVPQVAAEFIGAVMECRP